MSFAAKKKKKKKSTKPRQTPHTVLQKLSPKLSHTPLTLFPQDNWNLRGNTPQKRNERLNSEYYRTIVKDKYSPTGDVIDSLDRCQSPEIQPRILKNSSQSPSLINKLISMIRDKMKALRIHKTIIH